MCIIFSFSTIFTFLLLDDPSQIQYAYEHIIPVLYYYIYIIIVYKIKFNLRRLNNCDYTLIVPVFINIKPNPWAMRSREQQRPHPWYYH